MAKFYPSLSPMCPKCLTSIGTFGHLIWYCPRIRGFWGEVVQLLHDQMGSLVTMDPRQCLLRPFPDSDKDKHTLSFVHETLFTASKLVAPVWI